MANARMPRFYRHVLVLLLGLLLSAASLAGETAPADFQDFPATPAHTGATARPRLLRVQDRLYRTQIRLAAQDGKVNFAGHYVLSAFGCGGGCLMAFALDTDTGQVSWLPFTVSWSVEDKGIGVEFLPFDFRPDSRLLIIAGSRNEHGHGLYRYLLEHGRFRLLHAQEDPPNGLWE